MSIAEAIWVWLNSYMEKAAAFSLDNLMLQGGENALTLQPLSEKTVRHYINDSRLVAYRFAVFLRSRTLNDEGRAKAFALMEQLVKWAKTNATLPNLGEGRNAYSIKAESAPTLVERQAGADDFQQIFTLIYKESC